MNREVGLGSHFLSHSSPVPNKPYGLCGRKAPWKKKKLEREREREREREVEWTEKADIIMKGKKS